MGIRERVQHAWNAFMNKDPTGISSNNYYHYGGNISTLRPDRPQFTRNNRKSIVTAVYNRIAMDAAQIEIKHVRLDDNDRFVDVIDSGLNNCMSIEANMDQTGRAFLQDVVMSMLDEGCVAIVPVDTSSNPMNSMSYDILTLRTGRIIEWYPKGVKVKLYNERTGNKEDIIIPKHMVAIVENPLYAIINEQNSTMQRLIRKMNLLDVIDEKKGADKLDLIIQLPYVIKTEARRQQAETRRKDIEMQLSSSQYGIAYTDGTEKITQLNRSVDNQLQSQVEYLTSMLYSQLGLTVEIMNGTADEKAMLNYYNRTIEPILAAITDEMKRKFLTKTARSQKQSIEFFRDPFKLVPVADLAELADKFTRNEIMTSNEIRSIVGMKPAADPSADELRNKNLSQSNADIQAQQDGFVEGEMEGEEEATEEILAEPITKEEYNQRIKELDDLDAQLDEAERQLDEDDEKKRVLKHYASPYYDPVKAHEYYEEHKKLKGRHSTKGLNDSGKASAAYVKKQLDDERTAKIETHRNQTSAQIESNNTNKEAQISASKARRDSQVEANNNNKERLINSTKAQRDAELDSHKRAMESRISSLKNQLSGLSKEQKAIQKDKINFEISSLREDNKQKRAELNEAYKKTSKEISENTRVSNISANEEHKDSSKKISEDTRASNKSLNETHKQYKKDLKEEYDNKYADEMSRIREDSSMLEPEKKKKSSTKKSSTKKSSTKTSKKFKSAEEAIAYRKSQKKK